MERVNQKIMKAVQLICLIIWMLLFLPLKMQNTYENAIHLYSKTTSLPK